MTVTDTEKPSITAPSDMVVEATGPNGAAVAVIGFTTFDNCPSVSVWIDPAGGSVFPIGVTTVTGTAADGSGNRATASFTVTVRDTTPPVLIMPPDIITPATSTGGAAVNYVLPTATDIVDPSPKLICLPVSGSIFAIGTTVVTCTATDSSNNSVSGTFTVHVKSAAEQVADLITTVMTPTMLGPGTSLRDKLMQINAYIAASNKAAACTALTAFINEVRAQTGKAIVAGSGPRQAGGLIADATRIMTVLGC